MSSPQPVAAWRSYHSRFLVGSREVVTVLLVLLLPDPWGSWVPSVLVLLGLLVIGLSSLSAGPANSDFHRNMWTGFVLNLVAIAGFALIVVLVGTFVT